MAKTSIEPKFKCCECRAIHDDEDEAHECCLPDVQEVYLCPICDTDYRKESFAIDCCGFDSENIAEYRPTALELEAAGQVRLF